MDPSKMMLQIQKTADEFLIEGRLISNKNSRRVKVREGGSGSIEQRRFRAAFGVDSLVCAIAWEWLVWKGTLPRGGRKDHFLWACLQLMLYPSENAISTLIDVDEKTFRKWSWDFLLAFADLESDVIIWEDRFEGDDGSDCLTTVDCTDYRVNLQGGAAWFSYKFKKPGLRYEICLCIKSGLIVWINGPFPCGDYTDITIFRTALMHELGANERVECDDGYGGEAPTHCKTPKKQRFYDSKNKLKQSQKTRSRQETVNKRLKQFNCLKVPFRHDVIYHGIYFRAAIVLTQLSLKYVEPLFQVDYHD